jgi:hypothetical protein
VETELPPEQWTPRDRIVYLLDHWQDIFDPGLSGQGYGGANESVPLLPEMAHEASVVCLEQALGGLRLELPLEHAHLRAYRCAAEWRMGETLRPRWLVSGKKVFVPVPAAIRIVPSWVSRTRVVTAENWLLDVVEDVSIPQPLWDGLTKPVRLA